MLAVDLYSGIGGASLGLKAAGFNVCFACDSDPLASGVFAKNLFVPSLQRLQDVDPASVPHPELLFASPPSDDEIPAITDFLAKTNPRVVILEFPVRLINRQIIESKAELNFAGYHCWCGVLKASMFGLAQKRRVVYIVGCRQDVNPISGPFKFPKGEKPDKGIGAILEPEPAQHLMASKERLGTIEKTNAGNLQGGFGYKTRVYTGAALTPAIPTAYYKDYRNILVDSGQGPRRLSVLECRRMVGLPESYDLNGLSERQTYRLLACVSCPPMVTSVVKAAALWANCS